MPETDLASIGLDALDAHEAEEAAKGGGADPKDPVDPQDPADPADPTDPKDPADPVDPQDPADPADPSDPADPQDPADPVDPVDPKDPDPDPTPPAPPEPKVDDELSKYESAQAYALDKLPEIEIRGSDGDDGEIKTFKVKDPSELPDDFVPENHRDMLKAGQLFGENGAKRAELIKEYNDKVSDQIQVDFQRKLEQTWLGEIDELIADKRLQPITAKENTDAYVADPTVKRITEISDFMIKENDRLAKAGNPYRIQSVKHALDLLEAKENRDAAAAKAKADKKAADDANSKRGGMIGGGDGGSAKKEAPRVRPGMSIDDIIDSHDELE